MTVKGASEQRAWQRVKELEAEIERLKASADDQFMRQQQMIGLVCKERDEAEARLAAWKRAIYETAEVWGPGSSKIVADWIAEVERRAVLAAAQPQREHCGICGLYACGGHAAAQPEPYNPADDPTVPLERIHG